MLNKKKLQILVQDLEIKNQALENKANTLIEQINSITNNEDVLKDVLIPADYVQPKDQSADLMFLTDGLQILMMMYSRTQSLLNNLAHADNRGQVVSLLQKFLADFDTWKSDYLQDEKWENILQKININN